MLSRAFLATFFAVACSFVGVSQAGIVVTGRTSAVSETPGSTPGDVWSPGGPGTSLTSGSYRQWLAGDYDDYYGDALWRSYGEYTFNVSSGGMNVDTYVEAISLSPEYGVGAQSEVLITFYVTEDSDFALDSTIDWARWPNSSATSPFTFERTHVELAGPGGAIGGFNLSGGGSGTGTGNTAPAGDTGTLTAYTTYTLYVRSVATATDATAYAWTTANLSVTPK